MALAITIFQSQPKVYQPDVVHVKFLERGSSRQIYRSGLNTTIQSHRHLQRLANLLSTTVDEGLKVPWLEKTPSWTERGAFSSISYDST